LPQHSILFLIKNILSVRHVPEAGKFPASDRKFVEKRNSKTRVDGVKKCAVRRVKLLISMSARTGVEDRVCRIAMKVGIAGIDPAEIREQRDQLFVAMIDPVSNRVDLRDLRPRKNIAGFGVLRELHGRYHSKNKNLESSPPTRLGCCTFTPTVLTESFRFSATLENSIQVSLAVGLFVGPFFTYLYGLIFLSARINPEIGFFFITLRGIA